MSSKKNLIVLLNEADINNIFFRVDMGDIDKLNPLKGTEIIEHG